ncbi:HD domain-containing protein [Clostridium perfringens]|nr:HD domain-containing protein [Clostridium perfringens]
MEKEKERYPELATNSKFAKRVVNCGEDKHTIRNEFERDRDRIMYSRAFRRLSGKTQVFLAGNDDHVRTRLTHTLEVAQIARTISKALGLNEYLTEAIALGHDIGHTPFGHIGERMLNSIMNGCYKI